ncbi:hypothetical protein AURDEDRAFT_112507 [Auricularia subglabra TFB-10046 SS5]|nr:hypothetical protein AURDEDRAFT_112507 [Auricularia subglabra TFB-10046 SS5]
MTLRYTRKTFVGPIWSSTTYYGALAGYRDGCTIGPLLHLHRAGEKAFPETIPALRGDSEEKTFWLSCYGCGPGPPYDFFDADWLHSERTPEDVGPTALHLTWPDLPGQGEGDLVVLQYGDEGRDDIDEDGEECNGWRGAWVAELLDRETRNAEQDTRVEVKWRGGLWAVEVELKVCDPNASTACLVGPNTRACSRFPS